MVAYDFILPEDRLAIIHYIRNTFIPDAPQDSKDELTALDQAYNLSKGLQIAPQIPVSAAVELISKENDQRFQRIVSVLQKINDEKLEKGAEIFRSITSNEMIALTTLNSSTDSICVQFQTDLKFQSCIYSTALKKRNRYFRNQVGCSKEVVNQNQKDRKWTDWD